MVEEESSFSIQTAVVRDDRRNNIHSYIRTTYFCSSAPVSVEDPIDGGLRNKCQIVTMVEASSFSKQATVVRDGRRNNTHSYIRRHILFIRSSVGGGSNRWGLRWVK
ncbi:hypothetical protein CEXT_500881 [Caerostris extrusa]|uniref:Uncharacterized protein n=1 Tax=Caerostris extrusa TaxID=172846 RepID=A0AAV4XAP8_CAEEX|nr:hypothetical protein CEXT_500881 [Caerostris extrusa]